MQLFRVGGSFSTHRSLDLRFFSFRLFARIQGSKAETVQDDRKPQARGLAKRTIQEGKNTGAEKKERQDVSLMTPRIARYPMRQARIVRQSRKPSPSTGPLSSKMRDHSFSARRNVATDEKARCAVCSNSEAVAGERNAVECVKRFVNPLKVG